MMQVIFVIVVFKILNFFSVMVSGKFSAWNRLFLVAMHLYVSQINHKPSAPRMGATKMDF